MSVHLYNKIRSNEALTKDNSTLHAYRGGSDSTGTTFKCVLKKDYKQSDLLCFEF